MAADNPRVVEGSWKGRRVRFRRDRLIVAFRPGTSVVEALDDVRGVAQAQLGTTVGHLQPRARAWAVLTFAAHPRAEAAIPELAAALAQRSRVLYAEPDFEGRLHVTPGDDRFVDQKKWTDAVEMEMAWDVTQGSDQVLIAVFDSGIPIPPGATEPYHTELDSARLVVRHTYGGASVKQDYAAGDDVPADEYGHGTHVTGIIAATSNNVTGIAGINWVSRVYVARVVDEYGSVYSSYVKLAMDDLIDYATEYGYTRVVVNMSFGFWQESDAIKQVCDDSNTGVFLLCVGVGTNLYGDGLDYPGAYASTYQHVVAVGSVDGGAIQLPYLDNYAPVTIFAPGVDIISIAPAYRTRLWDPAGRSFDPYPLLSGTSQAAAIVSGIASLLWSAGLALTPSEVRDRLVDNANTLVSGKNEVRVVNALAAVANAGAA